MILLLCVRLASDLAAWYDSLMHKAFYRPKVRKAEATRELTYRNFSLVRSSTPEQSCHFDNPFVDFHDWCVRDQSPFIFVEEPLYLRADQVRDDLRRLFQ